MALWTLVAVIVVQLVIGYLADCGLAVGARNSWRGMFYSSSALGLYSSWTTALFSSLGVLPSRGTNWHFTYPVWLTVVLGLLTVPVQMLAPAFAAQSIAPDRENHQLEELLLAGFSPRQILLAKGLAALAPFLALWLVWETVSIGLLASGIGHRPTFPNVGYSAQPSLWTSIGLHVASAATVVARLAVMVCISAMCRRFRTALAACYGFAFLWSLLVQAAFFLAVITSANDVMLRSVLLNLGGSLVVLVILAVLVPRALQAIGEPEGVQQPPRRPMRIMDYGAEEPSD